MLISTYRKTPEDTPGPSKGKKKKAVEDDAPGPSKGKTKKPSKKKKPPKKKKTPLKKKRKRDAAAPPAKVVKRLKDFFSEGGSTSMQSK